MAATGVRALEASRPAASTRLSKVVVSFSRCGSEHVRASAARQCAARLRTTFFGSSKRCNAASNTAPWSLATAAPKRLSKSVRFSRASTLLSALASSRTPPTSRAAKLPSDGLARRARHVPQ